MEASFGPSEREHEGLDAGVEELDTSADTAVVVLVDVGAVGRRSRLAVEAESATYRRAPYGAAPDLTGHADGHSDLSLWRRGFESPLDRIYSWVT